MEICANVCAECIVCPCCNGRVGHGAVAGGGADSNEVIFVADPHGQGVHYPRSALLREHMSEADYTESLARWADDQAGAYSAKCLVEYDRALWARECGAFGSVHLLKLSPADCSPKHHVLYLQTKVAA